MKTSMTLGRRIAVGFGLIIIIAALLGVMASLTMLGIQGQTEQMARELMPEVKSVNEIERHSLLTMYEARGFAFAEEADYLTKARENLAGVKKAIAEAHELADRSAHLEALKVAVGKVEENVNGYEASLNETETLISAMVEDRKQMDTAASTFGTECTEYLHEQYSKQVEEFAAKSSAQTLKERAGKIESFFEIMDTGDGIQIAAWKSQVLRDPKIIQDAMPQFETIFGLLDEVKAKTSEQVNLDHIAEVHTAAEAYRAGMQDLLTNWTELQALNARRLEQGTAVLDQAEAVSVDGLTKTMASAEGAAGSLAAATTTTMLGLLGVMVIGVVLAIVITRSITGPINRVIAGLGSGSEQVASAANQVAQSSQQMAEGASEQASSLEEVSSSLEEITSMTRQNAENARQANGLAETARSSAENGNEAMRRMADAINKIKESADQTARIVKTIDEIAFQTNLLALNAAVEAARAGDAGKGFAVVAEEVRSLAQRSADAAKTTAQLIEESQRNSENGVNVSSEVAKILVAIVEAAGKVNRLVSEVAAASEEQAQGIDQVNTAVAQMDKVTQSNAANAEESSSASEELSAQARELQDMVLTLVGIVGAARGHNGHSLAAPAKRIALGSGTKQALRHSGMHAAHALHGNGNGTGAPKARAANKVIAPEAIIPLDDEDMKDF